MQVPRRLAKTIEAPLHRLIRDHQSRPRDSVKASRMLVGNMDCGERGKSRQEVPVLRAPWVEGM